MFLYIPQPLLYQAFPLSFFNLKTQAECAALATLASSSAATPATMEGDHSMLIRIHPRVSRRVTYPLCLPKKTTWAASDELPPLHHPNFKLVERSKPVTSQTSKRTGCSFCVVVVCLWCGCCVFVV